MTSVVLVDGVGRTRILSLERAPALIEFTPAAEGPRPWPMGPVIFDLQPEPDAEGRPIYRQRGMGTPEIRWYKPRPALPKLRLEESTEGSTGE